jgi:hypothetical protein
MSSAGNPPTSSRVSFWTFSYDGNFAPKIFEQFSNDRDDEEDEDGEDDPHHREGPRSAVLVT